jgi:hypothetical protein
MSVILRRARVDWAQVSGPVFMLIGPVRGAHDWHLTCYSLLEDALGDEFVAYIPRRLEEGHPLFALQAPYLPDSFERQTHAERYYIGHAGFPGHDRGGCIIGWLPCEDPKNRRPRKDGPYSQDTYGEIGELRGRMMHEPNVRFELGAEEKFHGLDVMRCNFEAALGRPLTIHPTLEKTVAAALRQVL